MTGQEWLPETLEVALPDVVVDFAVSFYFGVVEPDDMGFVHSWLVPLDDEVEAGFECFVMPGMGAVEPALQLVAA